MHSVPLKTLTPAKQQHIRLTFAEAVFLVVHELNRRSFFVLLLVVVVVAEINWKRVVGIVVGIVSTERV